MTIFIITTNEQSFSGLKYFYYHMISAISLQRFIGDESQIATMQRTFVLIIMSYPSYRRHACLYLFTRRPRPQVSTCRVMYITCTFLLPLARFGGHVPATCPGASGVASLTIYSRYANFKLLSLFISLEIDSFHSQ